MATGVAKEEGGRLGLVRRARWVLFALLIASAALTLFVLPELQRAVASGRLPPVALAVPPAVLALFVVGYAGYRLTLVRAGRYPAGKALVQIAVMALVLAIVVRVAFFPGDVPVPASGPVALGRLLASGDPEVRAAAAELLRHRPRADALANVEQLGRLLDDPSPAVRREAHASLVALAGRDAGGEGPGAAARWREHWRRSSGARR